MATTQENYKNGQLTQMLLPKNGYFVQESYSTYIQYYLGCISPYTESQIYEYMQMQKHIIIGFL
jgi:hypothetical protein